MTKSLHQALGRKTLLNEMATIHRCLVIAESPSLTDITLHHERPWVNDSDAYNVKESAIYVSPLTTCMHVLMTINLVFIVYRKIKNGIILPDVLFQLSICNSIIFAALLIRHAADLYAEWYLQQKNQSDEHKSGQD